MDVKKSNNEKFIKVYIPGIVNGIISFTDEYSVNSFNYIKLPKKYNNSEIEYDYTLEYYNDVGFILDNGYLLVGIIGHCVLKPGINLDVIITGLNHPNMFITNKFVNENYVAVYLSSFDDKFININNNYFDFKVLYSSFPETLNSKHMEELSLKIGLPAIKRSRIIIEDVIDFINENDLI